MNERRAKVFEQVSKLQFKIVEAPTARYSSKAAFGRSMYAELYRQVHKQAKSRKAVQIAGTAALCRRVRASGDRMFRRLGYVLHMKITGQNKGIFWVTRLNRTGKGKDKASNRRGGKRTSSKMEVPLE
jgi:hypothetical protein